MAATPRKPSSPTLQQQITLIEGEINDLKMQLTKPHFFADSPEGDLDIKTKIIDKQNEMIELLIKLSNNNDKSKP